MARPTLRALKSDADVMHLQRLLLGNGYGVGQLEVSGLFDSETKEQVEIFQLQHIDSRGRPLVSDGIVGESTWWALENPSGEAQRSHLETKLFGDLTAKRQRLLELLFEEHAKPVQETPDGSNRSRDIDGYWGPTGLVGLPWCCAFVSWALHELLGEYPIGGQHHVGVQRMWRAARRLRLEAASPKPGDVFVQIKSNGQGHTGFVVGLSEDGDTVYTCEGNCGNRLKAGRRSRGEIHHYIDCLQDDQPLDFTRGDPGTSQAVTGERDR